MRAETPIFLGDFFEFTTAIDRQRLLEFIADTKSVVEALHLEKFNF